MGFAVSFRRHAGKLADFAYANRSRQYLVTGGACCFFAAARIKAARGQYCRRRAERSRANLLTTPGSNDIGLCRFPGESFAAAVDNKVVYQARAAEPNWWLRISGFPQEGIEMQLQVSTSEPLKIRLVDQSYGLPQLKGVSCTPRPQPENPTTTSKTDFTLLSQTVSY